MDLELKANLRNFKDFLQTYNKMTETCFARCVDNMNSRNLESNESVCVEECASKFIKCNNRLMSVFMETQTAIVNRRIEEQTKLLESQSANTSEYLNSPSEVAVQSG